MSADDREAVSPDDVRARQIARQAEAVEQLVAAVQTQNELMRDLVDAIHYGRRR